MTTETKPKTLKQQLAALNKIKEPTVENKAKIEELTGKIALEDKAKAEEAERKRIALEEASKKEEPTDYDDYQKFAELKFLQWKDGTYESKNLNPESLKVFNALEKRFKDYKGKVPKIDKTLALGSDGQRCRIVKGYAAPKSLYDKYKEYGQADKYFE